MKLDVLEKVVTDTEAMRLYRRLECAVAALAKYTGFDNAETARQAAALIAKQQERAEQQKRERDVRGGGNCDHLGQGGLPVCLICREPLR